MIMTLHATMCHFLIEKESQMLAYNYMLARYLWNENDEYTCSIRPMLQVSNVPNVWLMHAQCHTTSRYSNIHRYVLVSII